MEKGRAVRSGKNMKILMILLTALVLFGTVAALADEPDGYVMTGGRINDSQTYAGTWPQSYQQILNNHDSGIHAYQNRTLDFYMNGAELTVPCRPVSLTDLTGDGIPELLFLEAADNDLRGDLYIYSSNGSSARCVLYVPGITRLGYDDAGLGFSIYLTSAGSGTLVLEYYEYEKPWVLQLTRNALGQYSLLNYYTPEYDYSGEGDDYFCRNGNPISYDEYASALSALENGRTMIISRYFAWNYSHYGLDEDWETAMAELAGYLNSAAPRTQPPRSSGGVYGLTVDKLSTRTGPGTQYSEGGTYNVKNQYIKVLAKAWDRRNSIWWVKCEIPYHGEIRILWTGYKRFDPSTLSLDDLPESEF